MAKTIEIKDVPADQVETIRQSLRDAGADVVESIRQEDGSFTLKAVLAEDSSESDDDNDEFASPDYAGFEGGSRDASLADDDSGLPGDPDFPTDDGGGKE